MSEGHAGFVYTYAWMGFRRIKWLLGGKTIQQFRLANFLTRSIPRNVAMDIKIKPINKREIIAWSNIVWFQQQVLPSDPHNDSNEHNANAICTIDVYRQYPVIMAQGPEKMVRGE